MAILNTITQINETIKSIIADIDFSTSTFSKKMSSSEANSIFSKFQSVLNSLYEKARLVQDLREYSEKYIENEFYNKYTELQEIVNAVETADKDYQNKRNITHEVLFNDGSSSVSGYVDFDSTNISTAVLTQDGYLTLPYDTISISTLRPSEGIDIITNSMAIKEEVIYNLSSAQDFNYIEISNPNCIIDSIALVDKENNETIVDDIFNPFIDMTDTSMIKLIIESNNPEEISQEEYRELSSTGVNTIF